MCQAAQERLAGRAAVSGRLDDNEHSVEQQWAVFQEQTLPVREHFKAKARSGARSKAAAPTVLRILLLSVLW
jgi:adenylate kinase family enzyme